MTVRSRFHRPRWRPLALTAALLAAHAAPLIAAAAPAEPTIEIRQGAQPLDRALLQLAARTGLLIGVDSTLVRERLAPALNGRYTAQAALSALLEGSGLEAVQAADGSWSLRRVAAPVAASSVPAAARTAVTPGPAETVMPVLTVKAGAVRESAIGPVPGYVARRSATASKTDTPLIEVPQSVSVVGREEMDARGVQDIMDVIRYTPGVSVNMYGPDNRGWEDIMLRGFSSYYASYRDGLAQTPFGVVYTLTEPFGLERVEVLRGPASMTFGQGDAGGIVHRVSKQPTGDSIREIEVQLGSHQRRQLAVDVAGVIDADPAWAWRVVGVGLDSNDQDRYSDGHPLNRTRQYLAPSLRWQPSAATTLTLQGEFIRNRSPEDPYYIGSDYVLTDAKMGDYSFSRAAQDQASVGYRLEHRVNDDWTVRQVARHSRIDFDRRVVWVDALQADGHTVSRLARTWNDTMDQTGLDTNLLGRLRFGMAEHTLLFGLDWNNQNGKALRHIGTAPDLDVRAPVYGQQIPTPQDVLADYTQTTRQLGLYAQDQIKLDERWVLTLGGRQDHVKSRTDDRANAVSTVESSHAFSGRGGVTYLLGNGWAPYLSHAESFLPNSGVDADNRPFKPSRGKQVEAGIKYQAEASRTYFAAALFDLRKTNVVTYDNVTFDARQIGKQRARGLELELKTELLRGLSATASYTRTNMKVLQSAASTELGKAPPGLPKQMASIWLDYTTRSGWGIAGGMSHTGRRPNDEVNSTTVPSFTLVDAALRYETGPWRLALNVSNLFDKKYLSICYHGECYRGTEQNVTASVRYRF